MSTIQKTFLTIAIIILVILLGYSILYLHSYLVLKNNNNQVEILRIIYTDIMDDLSNKSTNVKVHHSGLMNFITNEDFSEQDSKLLTSIFNVKNSTNIDSTLKVMYNDKILTISVYSTPFSDVVNSNTYTYKIIPKFNRLDYERIY